MARERALAKSFANHIASYLNEFVSAEKEKGNPMAIRIFDGTQRFGNEWTEGFDEVSVEQVQDISVSDRKAIVIASASGDKQVSYRSDDPYVIQHDDVLGNTALYVDELVEQMSGFMPQMTMSQPVKEDVSPKQEEKASSAKTSPSPAKAEAKSSKPFADTLMLVGVSKRAVQFRNNQDGPSYVNVAVPWKASKNGLAYIDIRRDIFDKANTPDDMKKRKTYHVPLTQEKYGMWYVDKDSDKSVKPKVSAKEIHEAYEQNKAEYRKSRIRKDPEVIQEQESVRQGVELPETSTASGPSFDTDLDL